VGRAVRTNQPVLAPDVHQDYDYVAILASTQTEIAVPLRKGGVVFGVLNVESPHSGSLTEDDLRLLTLMADQISVAIENAALYEHLRQHADGLERTVAERTAKLGVALEQARQADRFKSQFVSDVSHELRTPLSNIRLYLDLLTLGKDDRFESYLDTLTRETDRLSRLINDLLTISRIDVGATSPHSALCDLNAMAQALVQDRLRLFAKKGLELRFEPDAGLPSTVGDERMLSQVVANLLTNALQYTPRGVVRVSTAREVDGSRTWSTLTVSDTGLGISSAEQARIFERFYRGESSRQVRAPGTGLGLAICAEIVERHRGKITLQSEPGAGSRFTIWLPAGEGSPAAPSATEADPFSIL
jgi:signal transduction histidine kinase